jgi:FkbM family methyltransferase
MRTLQPLHDQTFSALRKPLGLRKTELLKAMGQFANDVLLSRFGLRLTAAGRPTRNFVDFFRHLMKLGFSPTTVIDVGVAYGTHDLYAAFPGARFCLVEPVAEFEPFIRELTLRYDIKYVIAAAGPAPGHIAINIHSDPRRTSALPRPSVVRRTVPVVTLDGQFAEHVKGPCLLKVDTEGHELSVLEGAAIVLQRSDVVILETRLISYVDGLPDFSTVVSYMQNRGFRLYDILDGGYRPLDGALELVDLVFIPEGSALHRDRRYSTADDGDW